MAFGEGAALAARGRKLGQSWINEELQKLMGISSGATAPWELPEFKRILQFMQQNWDIQQREALRTAASQGISGGALGQLLESGQENVAKKGLGAIQGIYESVPQNILALSKQSSANWNDYMQNLMSAFGVAQQKRAQDKAESKQRTQSIISGITSLLTPYGGFNAISSFAGAGKSKSPGAPAGSVGWGLGGPSGETSGESSGTGGQMDILSFILKLLSMTGLGGK